MTKRPPTDADTIGGMVATIRALRSRNVELFESALAVIRQDARRRYTVQCVGCAVTIHDAHDQQRYCSKRCQARYRAAAKRQLADERRDAMRARLYRKPDYER